MSARISQRPGHPIGSPVVAPRTTRLASLVVVVGVFIQAALAGGFLAGHSALTSIHMAVGVPLVASSLVLAGIGVFARRNRRETGRILLIRFGTLVALLATAILGILSDGARELLMAHIPLAVAAMGMAARLADRVVARAPTSNG